MQLQPLSNQIISCSLGTFCYLAFLLNKPVNGLPNSVAGSCDFCEDCEWEVNLRPHTKLVARAECPIFPIFLDVRSRHGHIC